MGFLKSLFGGGERCKSCGKRLLSAHGFKKGGSYTFAGNANQFFNMMESAPKRPYQCDKCDIVVCGQCAGSAAQRINKPNMVCPICHSKVRAL